MSYLGKPRLWIFIVVITWPLTMLVLFPVLGLLTLLTCGVFRGMDLLEDFIDWQMNLEGRF